MYIGMEIRMRADILSTTIQIGKREKYLKSTEKVSTWNIISAKYTLKWSQSKDLWDINIWYDRSSVSL